MRCFVDAQSARNSPVAEMVRRYPIKSDNVIAHIRKATQGRVALENTHPFVRELWGRYWVFAHNGDLQRFAPRLHAAFRPVGDTDSERAFCWLLQELNKSHASMPGIEELTRTLGELVPRIAAHGTLQLHAQQRRGAVGALRDAACTTSCASIRSRSAVLQDEDLTRRLRRASPRRRTASPSSSPSR